MNSRQTLDKYLQKLDIAIRTRSKEVRFTLNEASELQLAITQILLNNSETREANSELRGRLLLTQNESNDLDGGSFKDEG